MADQTPRIRKNPKIKDSTNNTSSAMEDLLIAKAKKETALAEQAQLELSLAKKHLLIREDITKTLFEESRNLRDKLQSLCTKLAPKLSKATKPDEVKKILKEEINNIFRDYIQELEKKL